MRWLRPREMKLFFCTVCVDTERNPLFLLCDFCSVHALVGGEGENSGVPRFSAKKPRKAMVFLGRGGAGCGEGHRVLRNGSPDVNAHRFLSRTKALCNSAGGVPSMNWPDLAIFHSFYRVSQGKGTRQ